MAMSHLDLRSYPISKHSNWVAIVTSCLLLIEMFMQPSTLASDRVTRTEIYEGNPIEIRLRVGTERQIRMDESVELGIRPYLQEKLHIENVQGTLYLTALESFLAQRMVIKGVRSGKLVLINLSGLETGSHTQPIEIKHRVGELHPARSKDPSPTPIQLLRYAAQHIYAPSRLLPEDGHIHRYYPLTEDIQLFENPVLKKNLLGAWQTDTHVVLAFEVSNVSDEVISLRPRDSRGNWQLMATLSQRLLPHGKLGSTSVVFVIGLHSSLTT